jgi:hypothetical protein
MVVSSGKKALGTKLGGAIGPIDVYSSYEAGLMPMSNEAGNEKEVRGWKLNEI